jgi:hypothetical protein
VCKGRGRKSPFTWCLPPFITDFVVIVCHVLRLHWRLLCCSVPYIPQLLYAITSCRESWAQLLTCQRSGSSAVPCNCSWVGIKFIGPTSPNRQVVEKLWHLVLFFLNHYVDVDTSWKLRVVVIWGTQINRRGDHLPRVLKSLFLWILVH